jgi:hypothetical protein
LREIEVDDQKNVFILSAHAVNDNDWVLIYSEGAGDASPIQVSISDPVRGPTAMMVSADSKKLYVASSVNAANGLNTTIFEFTIEYADSSVTDLTFPPNNIEVTHPEPRVGDQGNGFVSAITSIHQDYGHAGGLFVTGFSAPKYGPAADFSDDHALFTTPTLAVIRPGAFDEFVAAAIPCHDLALPLSIVFGNVPLPKADFDADNDVDLDDFMAIAPCLAGPSVDTPPEGCTMPGLDPADLDCDSDVDLRDIAIFHRAVSRP